MTEQKSVAGNSSGKIYGEPAVYTPSNNPMFRFNPYIEALHPALTPEKAMNLMKRNPAYNEEMRTWTPLERCQQVQEITNIIVPTLEFLDLEERFGRMIRNGYMARNPIAPMWLKQLQSAFPDLDHDRGGAHYTPKIRSNAAGFNILGLSGSGKTTAVESVLATYTQVIDHTVYRDIPFDQKQLVWLKLECPANGSTRSLCLDFFRSVDKQLGTRYSEIVGKRRFSTEDLLQAMPAVAESQGLGVLVIDEIQRLNSAHSGGDLKMLDFFVELTNKIGVPIVLIGTFRALRLFQSNFALARRSTGQGDMIWSNLAQDDAWDYFVESLWEYQWTKSPTPLSPALKKVLYAESFGIIDVIVKLYMLSQLEVIGSDDETITPNLIRNVAREKLKILRPLLKAAQNRKVDDLIDLEDTAPNKKPLEHYLEETRTRILLGETLATIRNQRLIEKNLPGEADSNLVKVAAILESAGFQRITAMRCSRLALDRHPNETDIKKAVRDALTLADEESAATGASETLQNSKNKPEPNHKPHESTDLRGIIADSRKSVSNYDALKNSGVIVNPCELRK